MLEIIGRLMPVSAERKLKRLECEMADKREEIEELQIEIAKVQAQIEREEAEQKIASQNEETNPCDLLNRADADPISTA